MALSPDIEFLAVIGLHHNACFIMPSTFSVILETLSRRCTNVIQIFCVSWDYVLDCGQKKLRLFIVRGCCTTFVVFCLLTYEKQNQSLSSRKN